MENELTYLYLDDIIPNRFQPRENFDEQALKELAVSIKEHGVIQPIIVRKIGEKFEIIAGERRYKASTMAGLTKIPAIIKNLDDKESSKVALIENLQRKDLTPIEEARTYQKILELDALTQEDLARTMGKSQSAVSNKLRLLTLTEDVQDALLHEQISERHARALLNVTDPAIQTELLKKVISSRMTVRELDEEIKRLSSNNYSVIQNQQDQSNAFASQVKMNNYIDNLLIPKNENQNQNNNNNLQNGNPTTVDLEKQKNDTYDIFKKSSIPNSIDNMLVNKNINTNKGDFSTNKFILNNDDSFESENSKNDLLSINNIMPGLSKPIYDNLKQNTNNIGLENNLYQNYPSTKENNSISKAGKTSEVSIMPKMDKMQNDSNQFASDIIPKIDIFSQNMQNTQIYSENNINNVSNTIKKVKDTLNDIEKSDSKINVEEFDFDDFYQIVVRINKNNP